MKRLLCTLLAFILCGVSAWAFPNNSPAVKADYAQVFADKAAIKTDQQALNTAIQQLNADEASNVASAVTTDLANINTAKNVIGDARTKLRNDENQLKQDVATQQQQQETSR